MTSDITTQEREIRMPESQLGQPSADDYRNISMSAVVTAVIAVLSLGGLVFPMLLILPLVGVLLGLYSISHVRRNASEFTGLKLAQASAAASALLLVGGIGFHATIYATEVPEGHTRVSFAAINSPTPRDAPEFVPEEALQLDGKLVFIKGYVFPGARQDGIHEFLLVGDRGDCCFGGNPKITDRIQVQLRDSDSIRFSTRRHKVAGIFRVKELQQAIEGEGGVYYHIEEAVVK